MNKISRFFATFFLILVFSTKASSQQADVQLENSCPKFPSGNWVGEWTSGFITKLQSIKVFKSDGICYIDYKHYNVTDPQINSRQAQIKKDNYFEIKCGGGKYICSFTFNSGDGSVSADSSPGTNMGKLLPIN